MDEQKKFSSDESFPYALIADTEKIIGEAYKTLRTPEMDFYEAGIPRRITYLISPDGMIAKTYDLEAEGSDFATHAAEILKDIKDLT